MYTLLVRVQWPVSQWQRSSEQTKPSVAGFCEHLTRMLVMPCLYPVPVLLPDSVPRGTHANNIIKRLLERLLRFFQLNLGWSGRQMLKICDACNDCNVHTHNDTDSSEKLSNSVPGPFAWVSVSPWSAMFRDSSFTWSQFFDSVHSTIVLKTEFSISLSSKIEVLSSRLAYSW